MKTTRDFPLGGTTPATAPPAPGPKGNLILGVMPEFNRDTLAFIEQARDYGDVVRMKTGPIRSASGKSITRRRGNKAVASRTRD